MSLSIPLKDNPGDTIELAFDNLPQKDDIMNILENEKPQLHLWIQLALEYYRIGRGEEFSAIVEGSGHKAALNYGGVEYDQMKAIDLLAAYLVKQAVRTYDDKEKKKALFARATLLYTTADKLMMYDQSHLAGRAYFCLVEGRGTKLEQASQQFNFVLKQNPNQIPAMLGMACISFNKKDYKTALYYYKKCLKQKPDGPADFRVGIGMCLTRLGQLEKARWAFERALEIDPKNVPATVALAVLDENTHTPEGLQRSVLRLSNAYKLDPENPVVLVNLVNHFFYRKELKRLEQLSLHALHNSDSEAIKAEACYQLARAYHVQKDYEKAFKHYYQATTLSQHNFVLPYFGLGQIHIMRAEWPQAISSFETILNVCPNCTDTQKILGSIYANVPDVNNTYRPKACALLSKYLQTYPDDTEVLIDLAQLLEYSDPSKATSLYEKAVDLIKASGNNVPAEIVNNIGSLYLNQGRYHRARNVYLEAEKILQDHIAKGNANDAEMLITIRYNMARCLEFLCKHDEAEQLYKDILKDQPNYVDCLIRLGCLARDRGQIYDASMLFKEAISFSQTNADPWTLIGLLHMSKHEWGPAQKKFEHVMKVKGAANSCDGYTHVALGNIWLESLFNPIRDRSNDSKHAERAMQFYLKALKISPKNMWAANGVGCILARKKLWQDARDVFSQIREATSEFFDVWVNIAHVYMETRQYVPAIQMYTNAMKKFGKENDPTMLTALARAYYASNKLQECRETLEKAMVEAPDNILLKFNFAFILKKMSKKVLEDTKATSSMVNGAICDLKTAERIYSFISANKDDSLAKVKLVSKTASGHEARRCHDLLKQAETYLIRAEEQDRIEEDLKRKKEEERNALMKKLERQKLEKELEEFRKREESKAMRHTFMEMTKEYLKLPEIKEEEKKSRGGGSRKKKAGEGEEFVNDSSDMGDWNGGEGGERPERKKKDKSAKNAARRRREKKEFIDDGTDDEEDKGSRKRKKADSSSKKIEPKLSAKQSAKIKSKAFLSSDSDSSDGPPPAPITEESPPPAIATSDSDDSIPKPKKLKPNVNSSNSDDESPVKNDDSDAGSVDANRLISDSDSDTPKKRSKKVASSEDSSSE